MDRIAASILHPVPFPAGRPDALRHRFRDVRSDVSIAVLPPGAMRRVDVGCMGPSVGLTRVAVHDGRLWNRVSVLEHGADGMSRRRDIPVGRFLAELGRETARREILFRMGTPLQGLWLDAPARDGDAIAGEVDHDAAPFLARCRQALADYAARIRFCGDEVYVETGLPCLAGCRAPDLVGAGWAWQDVNAWMLTRHDRWEDHARYVGRMQADDEGERFRVLSRLVEAVSDETGVAADDAGARVFANRLMMHASQQLERRTRRKAWSGGGEAAMLAAARRERGKEAVLGFVGALDPVGMGAAVRRCLATLAPLEDMDPTLRADMAPCRAYFEEVAAMALEPPSPEADADADALAALAP